MRGGQTDHPAHRRIRRANEIDRLTWGESAEVIDLDERRDTDHDNERQAI